MTFIVNGIKEGFEKKYNIELLLGVDSVLMAKKILEDTGIIILSLKEYKEQKNKFGNIYFTIDFLQQQVTLVIDSQDDIPTVCNFLMKLGFAITYINFFQNPLPDDQVKNIIAENIAKRDQEKEAEKRILQEKKQAEEKIYADPRLQTDKKVIERIFQKMDHTRELTKGFVSGKDLRTLNDKGEELKKLKLGTNHERIIELVQDMISMMETIEMGYYESTKENEKRIIQGSVTTDVDIAKEINKVDKAAHLKEVGAKIPSSEQDYLLLGKYVIYPKFLIKDLLHLFKTPKHLTNMIYDAFDIIEMIFMLVITLTVIYIIADIIFLFSQSENYEYLYINLIKIGLIGLLFYGARYLRKKNIPLMLLLIPGIIVAYFILIRLINNNFSL